MDSLQDRKMRWTQRREACKTSWADAGNINFTDHTRLERELVELLVEEYAPEVIPAHRLYAAQSSPV